jgi:hypothetical protein
VCAYMYKYLHTSIHAYVLSTRTCTNAYDNTYHAPPDMSLAIEGDRFFALILRNTWHSG